MTMSENSPPSGCAQMELPLMSSAADSPVSQSRSQESSKVLPMSGGSGLNLGGSFARSGPGMSSSKMSSTFFQDEASNNFRMTDAYAAGLIDGEGCISIQGETKRGIYQPRIDVGMTAKAMPVLEALKNRFGGVINKTRPRLDKWEEAHVWRVFGKPMATCLEALLPHLILKKQQAELALRLYRMVASLPRQPNGHARWSDQARKDGKILKALMQELNRRGPQHTETTGWFARLVGGTWITPQRDLLTAHGWEEYSGTLPRSGMCVNGRLFALAISERPISEIASGLLPTPSAATYGTNQGGGAGRVGPIRPSLETMARQGLLPTPTAGDAKASGSRNTATSKAHPGVSLSDYVRQDGGTGRLLPTPGFNDYRSGRGYSHGSKRQTPQLRHISGGLLNPEFVEEMFALPIGWSELRHSETRSSRRSRR